MTVIKRVCELRLGDKLSMIHGHYAATAFRSDATGNAEIVKLQCAPNDPDRITITALVDGLSGEATLDDREPVEVVSPEQTPVSIPCQAATVTRGIKRVCELQLDDVLTMIHGLPAQAGLVVEGSGAKLGRKGSVIVTVLEYSDPEHPESKRIKVTAQATDHGASGHILLGKQEPVEVEPQVEVSPG